MRPLLAPCLLTAFASAQGNGFVSPDGFASREGNTYHWAPFSDPKGRFQQVDPSVRRAGAVTLRSLAFRRDATQAGGLPRTVELDVWIGVGARATFGAAFDANFTSPPTAVFARKPVNLPDATTPPSTPPAPFGLVLTFDQPTSYAATQDLVWDLSIYTSSIASYALYPIDRAYTLWTYGGWIASGSGCTTANGRFAMTGDVRATATTLHLGFALRGAPANAAASVALGVTDVNVPIAGFCANLRPIVLLALPLGTCTATGTLATTEFRAPFDASLFQALLITQAFALDPTQSGYPIALSDGVTLLTPNQLGGTLVDAAYVYDTTDPLATIGSGPHTGGLVVRLGT